MAHAKLADECLWLKHIEPGPLRDALESAHPGSIVSLIVDGQSLNFQRMAMGKDGRVTFGFKPVGVTAATWRARYTQGVHKEIQIEFARAVNA